MGTYYGDVKEITGFTEESLKKDICAVFDCGLAAYGLFGKNTELAKARNRCLAEVLAHVLTFGFPNLDELKSGGPLQAYVAELGKAKEEQTRGGRV